MKFSIVHLSDIHFQIENNSILEIQNKIFDAFKNQCTESEIIFFVLSGDIAYSGQEEEYTIACSFLDFLEKESKEYLSKTTKFIIVTGNHDCNHQVKGQQIRKIILEKIRQENNQTIDKEIIKECTKVQQYSFDFIELYTDEQDLSYKNELISIHQVDHKGKIIQFNCFNTSWMSEKNEQQGQLYYPTNKIKGVRAKLNI